MNRLLLITLLILITLLGADRLLQHRAHSRHVVASTLRYLPGTDGRKADQIQTVRLELGDQVWSYRYQNGAWHYPAYKNAFVLGSRFNRFLEACLERQGTFVSDEASFHEHYGFTPEHTLKVSFKDSTETWQHAFLIGRSLPGRDTDEAFVRVAGANQVFHIHADPRKTLFWTPPSKRPPLIDPKVLPEALKRRAYVRFHFKSPRYPVREIYRVDIVPEDDIRKRLDGPAYEWHIDSATQSKKINSSSVYDFIGFLSRLKYENLHDPQAPTAYGFDRHIVLEDDSGTRDTLEVGAQTPEGNTYLRHRTSGHILSITEAKARLLFPSITLLDSLPKASPYQKAEPTGPFGFAP